MGFAVGDACYATAAEAGQAARWRLGHDTTILIGGAPHLLQYVPVTDGNGTRMSQKIYRMSDGVYVSDLSLDFESILPSCGVSLDAERLADMGQLWALMLVPVIAVWAGRKVYEFFDRTPHEAS